MVLDELCIGGPRMEPTRLCARPDDVPASNALYRPVHGHYRSGELQGAIAAGTARVVQRPDRISGYATGFGYGWHAVAEGNEHLQG